ncbi:MAG: hypothetical protein ACI9D0_000537 [Bacteroidia bacterium]|jgi:hypothetical protein
MKNTLWIGSALALSLSWVTGCRSANPVPIENDTQRIVEEPAESSAPLEPGPIKDALDWLSAHQNEDGHWDADRFGDECAKASKTTCANPGSVQHDVAATGLSLLAFLSAGQSEYSGDYRDQVSAALRWLRHQQDPQTGLIGERVSHDFLYGHAIATYALCEANNVVRGNPLIKRASNLGIRYIANARNPYGAWRYDVPPIGDNDTSVTGWMMLALKSAERGRLPVDQDAFKGALSWIDEVTDEQTGRVGYNEVGSTSARIVGLNEHFPPESGEAMTAIGLSIRMSLGQMEPEQYPLIAKGGELILRSLPTWEQQEFTSDMYYWYHATRAMNELGGTYAEKWNAAMLQATTQGQQTSGHAKGSWDPVGAWGSSGGRVYSTALMTMCLSFQLEDPLAEALSGLGYL